MMKVFLFHSKAFLYQFLKQNLSVEQLRKSLDVLMEADNILKSTGTDKKLVLEETMVKLLLISKEVSYD